MKVKVRGGTTNVSEALCHDCEYFSFKRSAISGREMYFCNVAGREQITEPAGECSDYITKQKYIHVQTLMPQAWILVDGDFLPSAEVRNKASFKKLTAELNDLQYTSAPKGRAN